MARGRDEDRFVLIPPLMQSPFAGRDRENMAVQPISPAPGRGAGGRNPLQSAGGAVLMGPAVHIPPASNHPCGAEPTRRPRPQEDARASRSVGIRAESLQNAGRGVLIPPASNHPCGTTCNARLTHAESFVHQATDGTSEPLTDLTQAQLGPLASSCHPARMTCTQIKNIEFPNFPKTGAQGVESGPSASGHESVHPRGAPERPAA